MFIFILLIPLMGFDKKTIVSNKQWLEQRLHENPHHVAIDPEGIWIFLIVYSPIPVALYICSLHASTRVFQYLFGTQQSDCMFHQLRLSPLPTLREQQAPCIWKFEGHSFQLYMDHLPKQSGRKILKLLFRMKVQDDYTCETSSQSVKFRLHCIFPQWESESHLRW